MRRGSSRAKGGVTNEHGSAMSRAIKWTMQKGRHGQEEGHFKTARKCSINFGSKYLPTDGTGKIASGTMIPAKW